MQGEMCEFFVAEQRNDVEIWGLRVGRDSGIIYEKDVVE